MFSNEPNECFGIRLPISGKSFEILKNSVHSQADEKSHGIFGVLVEVSIENALIHEVLLAVDWKQHPT